ncbi:MAG: hypothetical protein ABSD62_02035 [Candidatus Limnocylindrales bacterium]|jgi:hypothetical protein
MTILEIERHPVRDHLTGIGRRVSGSFKVTRTGATKLIERAPATVRATRAGAHATTSALQTLPDATLRSLAASSVGLGAGLYLAGKRRLVIVAGVAPALIMGAAIALRPAKPIAPTEAKS